MSCDPPPRPHGPRDGLAGPELSTLCQRHTLLGAWGAQEAVIGSDGTKCKPGQEFSTAPSRPLDGAVETLSTPSRPRSTPSRPRSTPSRRPPDAVEVTLDAVERRRRRRETLDAFQMRARRRLAARWPAPADTQTDEQRSREAAWGCRRTIIVGVGSCRQSAATHRCSRVAIMRSG